MTGIAESNVERRLREAARFSVKLSASPEGIGFIRGIGAGTDATQALTWLGWLNDDDRELVWARLGGGRWKMICFRFGISRPTAYRRWRHALGLIAWRLNGKTLPAHCSRRRFLQMSALGM